MELIDIAKGVQLDVPITEGEFGVDTLQLGVHVYPEGGRKITSVKRIEFGLPD